MAVMKGSWMALQKETRWVVLREHLLVAVKGWKRVAKLEFHLE